MINILKDIESRHQVDNILVNGEQMWPFLRMKYYLKYREYVFGKTDFVSLRESSFIKKLKLFQYILYGWKKWFKKYDYIAFSTSRQGIIKKIDGKYFNRLVDPIIDEIGKEKFLYIERPYLEHYPIRNVYTQNIISLYPLLFLAYILENIFLKKPKLEGNSLLKSIQKKYHLKINDHKIIKYFYAQRKIFRFLYRLFRPKAIFVVCYYDNFAAIKTANEMGIKVIEIQHGVIGTEHPAYNILVDLDKSFFPNYLLVFGKRDIEPFMNSQFINHKNVYPIGNFYLENITKGFKPDRKLLKKLTGYRRCVGVTLQWTVEENIIEFVQQAAKLDDTIFYILIPRLPIKRDYSTLNILENMMIITDKSFYELMMYADFHSTAYSTCALEAPSLGVQNIMINIFNLSKKYFKTELINENITQYVDTPKEFVEVINTFKKLDKKVISKLNEDIIISKYKKNITNFINKLNL